MNNKLHIGLWGLEADSKGELLIGIISVCDIAREYGTPLHIVNVERLKKTANEFISAAQENYRGKTSVHFAFKCNSVPGVIKFIKNAGLKAEVMTEYELELALRSGYKNTDIIVNGPCKTYSFLRKCVSEKVRFIVLDSFSELKDLVELTAKMGENVDILIRVNPDIIPRGMNRGTATGSRRNCAFGFDLKGGEVETVIKMLRDIPNVNFYGFHFHIGSGIRNPEDYKKALLSLSDVITKTENYGFKIKAIDVGGGFASITTRELTTKEMLIYQGLEKLPDHININGNSTFNDFTRVISDTVMKLFSDGELPELIYEPGRCIVSPNQLLVLKVHRVKNRSGIATWLITDGGLGTVSLPTYYEFHEVFLCNDVRRPRIEKVNIIGPGCFAGDIVYKNKLMPKVLPGEFIAIMDSGAYFTALESSFGYPRPAIAAVENNSHYLIRRRETFDDMGIRDKNLIKEISEVLI